jgi:hypothetical protein
MVTDELASDLTPRDVASGMTQRAPLTIKFRCIVDLVWCETLEAAAGSVAALGPRAARRGKPRLRAHAPGGRAQQRRCAHGTGTLYGTLNRLLGDGLIIETTQSVTGEDTERRRYYRLTADGERVAHTELERLRTLVGRLSGLQLGLGGASP